MSLKSSLLALANNIGMCQENARSIKQALAGGLAEAGTAEVNPWTLVKTETGSTEISIPENAKEIYYLVTRSNNVSANGIILTSTLGETAQQYLSGFYKSDSVYGFCIVKATAAKINLQELTFNGSLVTASTDISVYYR